MGAPKTVGAADLQAIAGDFFSGGALNAAISDPFSGYAYEYLNEYQLFVLHFNRIPNVIEEKIFDGQKTHNWFFQTYRDYIKDVYYLKKRFDGSDEAIFADIYYFLYEDVILYFNLKESEIKLLFRKTEVKKVENLLKAFQRFMYSKSGKNPQISMIVAGRFGMDTKPMPIKKPKLSIADNYNDDFKEIHELILKKLSRKNEKGLVLLHGKPGTGKTSYIRFLISQIKKEVFFMPPNLGGELDKPDLLAMLKDAPNSVVVIEDAEKIILDREDDKKSPVSSLLNVSDGLLSDSLNLQIICTFNTDVSKIDPALMRQGRLIALYEFKELTIEKAQKLSDKLGFTILITEPATLTEIYNQGEKKFKKEREKKLIGFNNGKPL